jgi:hypothetical protein
MFEIIWSVYMQRSLDQPDTFPSRSGIHILCCAVTCSAARGPLDFLVIRVSTDLEVIQRSTFCAARYCAAEEQDSPVRLRLISFSRGTHCTSTISAAPQTPPRPLQHSVPIQQLRSHSSRAKRTVRPSIGAQISSGSAVCLFRLDCPVLFLFVVVPYLFLADWACLACCVLYLALCCLFAV